VAFFPDGKRLVSGSESASHLYDFRLWNVAAGRWDYRIREHHAKGSSCIALSADAARCAVAGNAGLLTLYKVKFGLAVLFRLEHEENKPVSSVAFSPDGRRLMSSSQDNTIRVWDVETGRELSKLNGPPDAMGIQAARYLPDGSAIVSVTRSGTLQVWALERRAVLATAACSDREVRGLAVSPDGSIVATCGQDGLIKLWDVVPSGSNT
jgi:WD40 repeat protein